MGALISGAKYWEEFEDRLKEDVDSDGQVILFIEEIHTVVGAANKIHESLLLWLMKSWDIFFISYTNFLHVLFDNDIYLVFL